MDSKKEAAKTIDEYISAYPPEVQEKLQKIRAVIRANAAAAQEKISYQMPTFYMNGNLVHFAAFKNHIGFYPTPTGIEEFQPELSQYKGAKGSVQFPLNQEPPYDLIARIVRFRVGESMSKVAGQDYKKKKGQ